MPVGWSHLIEINSSFLLTGNNEKDQPWENNVQFQKKKKTFKKQSFLTAVFFLLESKISFELNLCLLNIYTQ